MPATVTHELEVGEAEVRGAVDRRHRVILPDWELIEIDALGDRPPPAPPLAWEGSGLMLAGLGDGGSPEPEDEDWELVELLDPDEDDPEPIEDLIEWPDSEDDWELEELDALGDNPAQPEPSTWSGTGLMAAGLDGGGTEDAIGETRADDDEDWQLESLAVVGLSEGEEESEDALEEEP